MSRTKPTDPKRVNIQSNLPIVDFRDIGRIAKDFNPDVAFEVHIPDGGDDLGVTEVMMADIEPGAGIAPDSGIFVRQAGVDFHIVRNIQKEA